MNTKTCIKCGIEKSLDDFYDAKGKNIKIPKKINTCKQCFHRITKENTAKHYEERKRKHIAYLADHPDETKVCRLCGRRLSIQRFSFHATKRDFMSSECRECRLEDTKIRIAKKKTAANLVAIPTTKVCKACGAEKPIGDFNTNYGNKDLHRRECRDCQKANQQKHYTSIRDDWNAKRRAQKDDPVERRKRHHQHIKRKFGISNDEYNNMLSAQHGKCVICGSDHSSRNGKVMKNFAVDHDHATGKVRSLLCAHCNQGLGNFLDSPNLLRKAAAYLESFTE